MSMNDISYFPDEDAHKKLKQVFDEFVKNDGRVRFEYWYQSKSGKKFLWDIKMRAAYLNSNPYSIIIARDITEKKKLEEQLKQSE